LSLAGHLLWLPPDRPASVAMPCRKDVLATNIPGRFANIKTLFWKTFVINTRSEVREVEAFFRISQGKVYVTKIILTFTQSQSIEQLCKSGKQ